MAAPFDLPAFALGVQVLQRALTALLGKPAALAAGAVSYLMKPCLPEQLAREVSLRLTMRRARTVRCSRKQPRSDGGLGLELLTEQWS
jgi:DNA-binding response OmpR family regulator